MTQIKETYIYTRRSQGSTAWSARTWRSEYSDKFLHRAGLSNLLETKREKEKG